jgi:hypothetical protein
MSPEMTRVSGLVVVQSAFLTLEASSRRCPAPHRSIVGVVVNLSGVHDHAEPQLPLRAVGAQESSIVVGQELAESQDGSVSRTALGTSPTGWIRPRKPSPRSANRFR